jgi:salicylate hydroxylase
MTALLAGGGLRIHRADLQRCLVEGLPLPIGPNPNSQNQCTLNLSHRLIDYIVCESPETSKHPVNLLFSEKPSRTCDLLIGADGIKSTVRQLFINRLPNSTDYQSCLEPRWSAAVAYRGLVDKETLKRLSPNHRTLDHPGIMVRS